MTYPKAVVFDLDYTLWPCWCDTHISTPIRKTKSGAIEDRDGFVVTLYPDVIPILKDLKEHHVAIFTASRTATPRIAKKMIKLFGLESYIDDSEWGHYSKVQHITALLQRHTEPLQFHEVCLFDDEWRNHDVETRLGVQFCHLPGEELTWKEYTRGIDAWRQRNGIKPM